MLYTLIAQCMLTRHQGRSLVNTFSYFTIQSNVLVLIMPSTTVIGFILAAVLLAGCGLAYFHGERWLESCIARRAPTS